jgi:hypothetical protein
MEGDEFGAAERAGEAQEQQRAVTQALQAVARSQRHGNNPLSGRRGLLARRGAERAADPTHRGF